MHLIITDGWFAKSRSLHLTGTKLCGIGLLIMFVPMLLSVALYHWVFVKAIENNWSVLGALASKVAVDNTEQQERLMRENIDAMARKLGEMQAKLAQLESLGERVSGLAGINPEEIKVLPGRGGALISGRSFNLEELQSLVASLDGQTGRSMDFLTAVESRLFDQKMKALMQPSQKPVDGIKAGSVFGWRIDPFAGASALHSGLDFPASVGTPILAAAGGVVVTQEYHSAYGNMVEVDHGGNLVTRYAHASKVMVKKGDLVKRGQKIAEIGSTGRSTGPHLHFEVLVQGIQQDPQKFLTTGENLTDLRLTAQTQGSARQALGP